jgi:hypothetical protein
MMGQRKIRRCGLALGLAAVLMMTGLACQPANTSAPAPNTNKPAEQKPDKKPSGQPRPDPG